ncbi:MAG: prolyl oligopeptidase family serine peptidase, partial [Bacteroidetes bacterium]|nr:prolyl oligopeptidase family serine peptidase [Bacteroidota bacterium]
NFSHNGTSAQIPDAFVEPEAFGRNTIGKELQDVQSLLNGLSALPDATHLDLNSIYLAGHSRGGGIALLSAARDKRIKKLALWNSVSDWNIFMCQFDRERWKADGVAFIRNSRTGQELPVGYTLYEDYNAHREDYHLGAAAESLEIPLLLVHGTDDVNVRISASEYLYEKVLHAIFIRVEGGDHTFGIRHPWTAEQEAVPAFDEALSNTIDFFLD